MREMKAPATDRWFEDYEPGSVHEFGSIRVDEEEVLAFGQCTRLGFTHSLKTATPTARRSSGVTRCWRDEVEN
jgi:hypothetical protein